VGSTFKQNSEIKQATFWLISINNVDGIFTKALECKNPMFCHMCWTLPQSLTDTNKVFYPVTARPSDKHVYKNVVYLSSLIFSVVTSHILLWGESAYSWSFSRIFYSEAISASFFYPNLVVLLRIWSCSFEKLKPIVFPGVRISHYYLNVIESRARILIKKTKSF
jgi:hypothetical protein